MESGNLFNGNVKGGGDGEGLGHLMDTDLDPTQMLEVKHHFLFQTDFRSKLNSFVQVGSYHDDDSMFTETSNAIKT